MVVLLLYRLHTIRNVDEQIPRERFSRTYRDSTAGTRVRASTYVAGYVCTYVHRVVHRKTATRTVAVLARTPAKDSRGSPEGLSEVRTVHYPRWYSPLRLLHSFPFVYYSPPSSFLLDPRALRRPYASPLRRSIIIFTQLQPRPGNTDLFPFLNAATSRNIVLLDASRKLREG